LQTVRTPAEDAAEFVRALSVGGESYYVEFKSAWHFGPEGRVPRDAREIAVDIGSTVVAFANADGGDLLVGVEDDGAITGVPHDEVQRRYLQAWQQQVSERGEGVSVQSFTVDIDGQAVLLLRVEASQAVVTTSDGRCLMRKKRESVPVRPEQVTRARVHVLGDRDYEAAPIPEATLDDLDWSLIPPERFVQGYASHGSESERIAQLRYWNLVEQRNGSIILRRAALLLFGKEALRWHPNNRVRVRRILGEAPGYGRNLQSREFEVVGPIVRALTESRSRLHQSFERESRQEQLFITDTLLPREAIDECLVNAVVHRNYAIEGQAVEILIYPDRVEFRSPGTLPDPLTIRDLEAQRGAHRSRNPVMMRVLRDLGWTRDQGEGMARIFGSMRQVELHAPELEVAADTFVVRLSTRSLYDAQTQAWIASYGPFGLQPEERRYLVALRQAGRRLSIDRLARQLGSSFDEVKAALTRLEERGMVWHRPKSRTYQVVEPLNVPHERVFRILTRAGQTLDASTTFDREQIAAFVQSQDQSTTTALLDQWKQAGILAPAGSKRFKLGPSFLAYVAARG
jgi:ATP-dependent DNA helicase RecG